MMDGPTWMPPLSEVQLNALARLIELWHRRVIQTGDETTQEMLDELREVCFGTVPNVRDEQTLRGNPTPQDIWSARLLVLLCDQDGERVEPEIADLAAQNVGPTGPWERKPVKRRRWWRR